MLLLHLSACFVFDLLDGDPSDVDLPIEPSESTAEPDPELPMSYGQFLVEHHDQVCAMAETCDSPITEMVFACDGPPVAEDCPDFDPEAARACVEGEYTCGTYLGQDVVIWPTVCDTVCPAPAPPPRVCENDALEPNETRATARPYPSRNTALTLDGEDVDVFSVTVPAGEVLDVRVVADANLDVRLYAADYGTPLASAPSTELYWINDSWYDEEVVIQVDSFSLTACIDYTLEVNLGTCVPDGLEPDPEGTDLVHLNRVAATVAPWNDDLFHIAVPDGERLTLYAWPLNTSGAAQLEILDANGTVLTTGSTDDATWTENTTGLLQTYEVRVTAPSCANYELEVELAPTSCLEPEEPNALGPLAVPLTGTDLLTSQLSPDDLDFYTLTLQPDDALFVDIPTTDRTVGVALYDATGSAVTTGTTSLTYTHAGTAAEAHILVVSEGDGLCGTYTLDVDRYVPSP